LCYQVYKVCYNLAWIIEFTLLISPIECFKICCENFTADYCIKFNDVTVNYSLAIYFDVQLICMLLSCVIDFTLLLLSPNERFFYLLRDYTVGYNYIDLCWHWIILQLFILIHSCFFVLLFRLLCCIEEIFLIY